ncbi:hypothetical protein PTT_05980 [Pyrenophora teres f. teres 0-1]|uniref:Uncharacterized protein n=2 Tax=Pyrenophora teres f. teres TaxID=97479 RepID=E3RFA6_PYRTT|nr:hypothetical protein PTT_05980 [Pyrenophora teres f. teres 0-1]CAE7024989.1 hypothetical protein PTTW11_03841 [Pyrenophora teres f. teres]
MLVNNPSPRSCESIYSSRRIHEIAQLEACEIARIPRVGDLRAAFRSSEQYKPSPDWAPAVPDWVSSRPLPSLPSLHPLPPAASHTITVEHKSTHCGYVSAPSNPAKKVFTAFTEVSHGKSHEEHISLAEPPRHPRPCSRESCSYVLRDIRLNAALTRVIHNEPLSQDVVWNDKLQPFELKHDEEEARHTAMLNNLPLDGRQAIIDGFRDFYNDAWFEDFAASQEGQEVTSLSRRLSTLSRSSSSRVKSTLGGLVQRGGDIVQRGGDIVRKVRSRARSVSTRFSID